MAAPANEEGGMSEPEPSVLGLLLVLAIGVTLVIVVCLGHPTPEERANMWDAMPTKNTYSTGVTWK